MKNLLLGAIALVAVAAAALAAVAAGGFVDVGADSPHSGALFELIDWARDRAVAHRAASLVPPPDLSDAGRMRRGAGNYDAMCAQCHLRPGVTDSEIRMGLYPQPPDLSVASGEAETAQADAERFWIIKHGIKATAMPAWSKAGMRDDEIWDLVALVRALPKLSADDYGGWVESSEGHHHRGAADAHGPDAGPDHHHHEHGTGQLDSHHNPVNSR
jgi:mono/diheme cytochrome c family protein